MPLEGVQIRDGDFVMTEVDSHMECVKGVVIPAHLA